VNRDYRFGCHFLHHSLMQRNLVKSGVSECQLLNQLRVAVTYFSWHLQKMESYR